MRTAILDHHAKLALLAALSSTALLLAGVHSQADEPVPDAKRVAEVNARLEQAWSLVGRLREQVENQRAELLKAEANLQLAEELAEELRESMAIENRAAFKAAVQRKYEAEKREKEKRGKQAAPNEPAFQILLLGQ